LRAARHAHPSRSGDDFCGQAGVDRAGNPDEDRAGTPMTLHRPSGRTFARIRTALVVATLAASVGLITARAQTPSQATPPAAADRAEEPPGRAPRPSSPQPADSQPPRQSPSFKVGVDLVSLNVTVSDGAARYVTDLDQQNFQVFEDGVLQDVTFF